MFYVCSSPLCPVPDRALHIDRRFPNRFSSSRPRWKSSVHPFPHSTALQPAASAKLSLYDIYSKCRGRARGRFSSSSFIPSSKSSRVRDATDPASPCSLADRPKSALENMRAAPSDLASSESWKQQRRLAPFLRNSPLLLRRQDRRRSFV